MVESGDKIIQNSTGVGADAQKEVSSIYHITILKQSDDAVNFEQNGTSLIGTAIGPIESKSGKECTNKAYVDVHLRYKHSNLPKSQKPVERLIQRICENSIYLEAFPRAAISILLQEVEDDGSFLAACVNTSCSALLTAGIPLKYIFTAVHLAIMADGSIIANPSIKQEIESVSSITLVYNRKLSIIAVDSKGFYTNDSFDACVAIGEAEVTSLIDLYVKTF